MKTIDAMVLKGENRGVEFVITCRQCKVTTPARAYLSISTGKIGVYEGIASKHCQCGGNAEQVHFRVVISLDPVAEPIVDIVGAKRKV